MKKTTLIELLTLSASIYHLAKETHLIDHINEISEKGKEHIKKIIAESQFGENGDELEFVDKLILKTNIAKEELEQKVEELVAQFYKKVNIAHLDELKALKEKVENADATIALLEARLNRLEAKK